jgi:hypothetical protein
MHAGPCTEPENWKQTRLLSCPGLIRLSGWGSATKPRNHQHPRRPHPSLGSPMHAGSASGPQARKRAGTTSRAHAAGGSRTRLTATSSPMGLGTPRGSTTPAQLKQRAQPVQQPTPSPATPPRPYTSGLSIKGPPVSPAVALPATRRPYPSLPSCVTAPIPDPRLYPFPSISQPNGLRAQQAPVHHR